MDVKVFNESGKGYWMDGFGCLRAEGENRPSRPTHIVCVCREVQMDEGMSIYVESIGHDLRSTQFSSGRCDTLTANDYKEPMVICFEPGIVKREGGANRYTMDKASTLRANMGDNQPVVCFRPKLVNCTEYIESDKSATLTLGYHYGGRRCSIDLGREKADRPE